jgi:hypothetical protein
MEVFTGNLSGDVVYRDVVLMDGYVISSSSKMLHIMARQATTNFLTDVHSSRRGRL